MSTGSPSFLDAIAERKDSLSSWIRGSVGEMDAIMERGFPQVFGKNWREKMKDFPTAARTKLLTYVFDYALEDMANRLKIDYRAANNEGPSETNNFDCYLFSHEVENKLSLGKSTSSFGTGSSHNVSGKVPRILAIKIKQSEDYHSKELFAAAIDLSLGQSDDTRWHSSGSAESSGFSSLKISKEDAHVIVPLCGGVRQGGKYLQSENEVIK